MPPKYNLIYKSKTRVIDYKEDTRADVDASHFSDALLAHPFQFLCSLRLDESCALPMIQVELNGTSKLNYSLTTGTGIRMIHYAFNQAPIAKRDSRRSRFYFVAKK